MIRYQWFLIVAIAAGLVGMHHLVQPHTAHTMSMTMATSPESSLMSVTPTAHAHPGPMGGNTVGARSNSTSVVTSQPDCCDPMDTVGHCCLAVLTAITAFAASLVFAVAWRRPGELGHLPAALSALAARSPPTGSVRFTQLCVLRL
ncbi:MAG: hypothetical protein ABIZ05_06105 [Pseudonocardiaceae bacterium]